MMKRILAAVLLLSLGLVWQASAQQFIPWTPGAGNGGGGCTNNCTFTGTTSTAGISDTGGINSTAATPFNVSGNEVINTLANQTSPIVSPETQNSPASEGIYVPVPAIIGYARTAGASTYEAMTTGNITINGTVSNHYGQVENTMNLVAGTGTPIVAAELNQEKSYVIVPTGMSLTTFGENKEFELLNLGTVATWSGVNLFPENTSSGIITNAYGARFQPANYNTATNTFQFTTGFDCQAMQGTGTATPTGHAQCVFNEDPVSEITNAGHYGARPTGAAPTASSCGSGATFNSRASDVTGTVTEGSGSNTSCVITFNVAYSSGAGESSCVVSSPNGSQYTSYAIASNGTTLTINHLAASGSQWTYMCMNGY